MGDKVITDLTTGVKDSWCWNACRIKSNHDRQQIQGMLVESPKARCVLDKEERYRAEDEIWMKNTFTEGRRCRKMSSDVGECEGAPEIKIAVVFVKKKVA